MTNWKIGRVKKWKFNVSTATGNGKEMKVQRIGFLLRV